VEPWFAIGQRALLVDGVMWDCVHFLDEPAAAEIERRGGLRGIAISHPHYYTGIVVWAHRFDCPVYIHAADERWIMRPDPAIELWEGDVKELGEGLTLVRCGGHFAGGTVLHWEAGRARIPARMPTGGRVAYPSRISAQPAAGPVR
jgi:glyoxylase-like metal-dependent hydrolase (beta-lactamase superfamily II)